MKQNYLLLTGALFLVGVSQPVVAEDSFSDLLGNAVNSAKNAVSNIGQQVGTPQQQSNSKEVTAPDGFKYTESETPDGFHYRVTWNKKLNKYYCRGTKEFYIYMDRGDGNILTIPEDEAIARKIPSGNGKTCRENDGLVEAKKTIAKQPTNSKYQEVDLVDLKLDMASFNKKKVSVVGALSIIGEIALLGTSRNDNSTVGVDISKLSKTDRKLLLTSCNSRCDAIRIDGVVRLREGSGDIVAEQISIN